MRSTSPGRPLCEGTVQLSVNDIRQYLRLAEIHSTAVLRWHSNGRQVLVAEIRATEELVEFRPLGDRQWQQIDLVYSAQRLGGSRAWFACPICNRRCGILYGVDHLACRRCRGLAYASQRQTVLHRALAQMQKFRQRQGGTGSIYEPFPARQREVRHATYAQLRERDRSLVSIMAERLSDKLR